jgi:O-antigen/teichoic acid export membrane protein
MERDHANTAGRSRFFPNALALVVQTVVGTVLAFVQIKILSNFLPAEDFGLFASLRGLALLLSLLAANGLPQLLVRFLPVHEASRDAAGAVRLGALSFAAAGGLLLVLLVPFYFLRRYLLGFVDPGLLTGELALWFAIATLGILFKQILYAGLQGLRRMIAQLAIDLLSLSAALAFMAYFRETLSLALLFRILGTVDMMALAIGLPLFFWLCAGTKGKSSGTSSTTSPAIVAYRAYLPAAVGIGLLATAFTDVDRFVVAQVLPLELIAMFHIGARVTGSTKRLLGVSNLALQPEFTRLQVEGRAEGIDGLIRVFLKLNVMVAVLVGLAIGVFARDIVVFVASARYASAAPLLAILSACIPLVSATAPLTTVMKATDRVGSALRVDLAWAVAYVALVLVLGATMGLIGIGLANLAACLLQLSVAVRLCGLDGGGRLIGGVFWKSLAAAILGVTPLILASLLLGSGPLALSLRILLFAGGCAVYALMLKTFRLLEDREKRSLISALQSRGFGGLARLAKALIS